MGERGWVGWECGSSGFWGSRRDSEGVGYGVFCFFRYVFFVVAFICIRVGIVVGVGFF